MAVAKEQIRQIISQNNISSVADVYSLLKESFKDILQELMEAELDAALGYEKNQKADFLTDKKNGHSPKIFKSHYGKSKLVFHGIGMGNRIIILTPSAIPFSLVLYLSEQKNNCHFICYGSLLSPVFYTTFNNTSVTTINPGYLEVAKTHRYASS